jgi:hypothetical protein
MRLFKGNQPQSEEDRAAGLRLENIANRYRALPESGEQASPEVGDEAPDSTEAPQ